MIERARLDSDNLQNRGSDPDPSAGTTTHTIQIDARKIPVDKRIYWYNIDTVMTDLILLGMLLTGPQHGYRLKQQAGMVFGQGELHNNLVYPLLRRFMANKWVTKKTLPGERGQNRQQYAITALGRQTLIERIRTFTEQDARSEDAFRVRVGFFEMLSGEDRERILQAREGALRSRDRILSNLQEAMDLGEYAGVVVGFLREQTEAELAWIARLRNVDSNGNKEQIETVNRRLL